ncbi:CHASE2 domain-containing protein [Acaryochloris sp. IP29b_bin.137]|uniref:CHASE2 domain-containing protein n=1 Tax=Acaryochloris sp. IP29b_bin.137 TaxID=2969217 RepID=UPI0026123E78|nr:CHASE2 domain-containing protein [Acaryochloris sp. IP29b_bin.137]
MTIQVVIHLGSGSLAEGCPYICATLYTSISSVPERCPPASLPASPELTDLYRNYQMLYAAFYGRQQSSTRALQIEQAALTNFSKREFDQVAQSLEQHLNAWLHEESFQPVYKAICQKLHHQQEIQVILETDDPLLRRLPWQLWDFFEDYPRAELALSLPSYGRLQPESQTPHGKVRILAVFGNGQGLDLEGDRKAMVALPGAEVVVLPQPSQTTFTREELNEALWDKQGWDILFFAGHSMTDTQTGIGKLMLNETVELSVAQLKHALKTALNRGLTLAIFNSCDGLGLAQGLSDLNIPQVIVMRDMVPDKVAQRFFTYFLEEFAQEKVPQSLYQSVRNARSRLQGLEDEYPYASWLPVISQNPTTPIKTWHQLRYPRGIRKPRLPGVLLMTSVISAVFLGIRPLGMLQPMELMGYDHFLQRPLAEERRDDNLFVIEITSTDLNQSISDLKLLQLLKQLRMMGARTIGTDILRHETNNPMHQDLKEHLKTVDNFFVLCRHRTYVEGHLKPHIPAPKSVNSKFHTFSNVPVDPDNVVRRQKLSRGQVDAKDCQARNSLSSYVAQDYLEHDLYPHSQSGKVLQLTENRKQFQIQGKIIPRLGAFLKGNFPNNVLFAPLEKILLARYGPYQGTKADLGGTQLLLNYRSGSSLSSSFPSASLGEVMSAEFDPEKVRDRIVLIGINDKSSDQFSTPFPGKQKDRQKISGVFIHAHMVSQLINFTNGHRHLIDVLPLWSEILWVWGWTTFGGFFLWGTQMHPIRYLLPGLGLGSGLYICCWGLFLNGLWVPLVPTVLALTTTGVLIWICASGFAVISPIRWSSNEK